MTRKLSFFALLFLGFLALATFVRAREMETEAELIADLSSPKEKVVADALQKLESDYPTSTNGMPAMRKLLADPRDKIMRQAALVLGRLNADVTTDDLKNISTLLASADKGRITDGLKALRGLKAQSTIPQILPLLQSHDENILRDSCRTLAVLGDKNLVPAIQPLLKNPDSRVQKDAADAIKALQLKG